MIVKAIKTKKVLPKQDLLELLDESLPELSENCVLAITSKIVALCEGNIAPAEADKHELIVQESDYYLNESLDKSDLALTIKNSTLVPAAGIDKSNSNGKYVLWPKNPQKSASAIRYFLAKKYGLKNIGLIITDSTIRPMHFGTEGTAIAFSGFLPVDISHEADLFGKKFKTSPNIADSLAVSAVVVMGEASEQTPLAMVTDVPFVKFVNRSPSEDELTMFYVGKDKDWLFGPILNSANWQKKA